MDTTPFTTDTALIERISRYSGLIFDMDGTLCDSEPMHHAANDHMLKELGFHPLPLEVLESYAGLPDGPMFEDMLNRLEQSGELSAERRHSDPALTIEALRAHKIRVYEGFYMPKVPAFESMLSLVKECAARGQRLALATSSPRSQADYLLEHFGIKDCFASIITGNMVEHGKPHPDIFLLAAQSLNLGSTDCLVFEDGAHGLAAAKAAHMDAIKCLNGHFDVFFPA